MSNSKNECEDTGYQLIACKKIDHVLFKFLCSTYHRYIPITPAILHSLILHSLINSTGYYLNVLGVPVSLKSVKSAFGALLLTSDCSAAGAGELIFPLHRRLAELITASAPRRPGHFALHE